MSSSDDRSGNPLPIDPAHVLAAARVIEARGAPAKRVAPEQPRVPQQEDDEADDDANDGAKPRRQLRYRPGEAVEERREGGTKTGWAVVRYIASGAFGDVYEVSKQTTTPCGRDASRAAMKAITLTEGRTGRPLPDAKRVRVLRRHVLEAHLMLRLGRHPNLVGIRAAFQIDNDFVFVEDLVPGGRTVKRVVRDLAVTTAQAATIARAMARGLAYMHAQGFVHWDVKPDNTLVEVTSTSAFVAVSDTLDETRHTACWAVGAVKITDFGVSTPRLDADDACVAAAADSARDGTQRWFRGCTDAYASPETRAIRRHADDDDAPSHDRRKKAIALAARSADEWAWAVTLVEMLTGARVTGGADDVPRDLPNSGPLEGARGLLALARRCLDDDPTQRPTARAILDAFKEASSDEDDDDAAVSDDALSAEELALLHRNLGQTFYRQLARSREDLDLAREHLEKSLRVVRTTLPDDDEMAEGHPNYASALDNLAELRYHKREFVEAKQLFERALRIRRKAFGEVHADVAGSLNNLGMLAKARGDYEAAVPLLTRAVDIWEATIGPDHLDVAVGLSNLGFTLKAQGRFDDARVFYERAVAIGEKALDPKHATLATFLNNLAALLKEQGKWDDAEALYHRSLDIRRTALGDEHPAVAVAFNNLAAVLKAQASRRRRAIDVVMSPCAADRANTTRPSRCSRWPSRSTRKRSVQWIRGSPPISITLLCCSSPRWAPPARRRSVDACVCAGAVGRGGADRSSKP